MAFGPVIGELVKRSGGSKIMALCIGGIWDERRHAYRRRTAPPLMPMREVAKVWRINVARSEMSVSKTAALKEVS